MCWMTRMRCVGKLVSHQFGDEQTLWAVCASKQTQQGVRACEQTKKACMDFIYDTAFTSEQNTCWCKYVLKLLERQHSHAHDGKRPQHHWQLVDRLIRKKEADSSAERGGAGERVCMCVCVVRVRVESVYEDGVVNACACAYVRVN